MIPEAVQNLLDRFGLKDWDMVNPAAGNDASGVPVTPELLGEITGGTWVDGTNPA